MNNKHFLQIGLVSMVVVSLWGTIEFRNTQERFFNKKMAEIRRLQKNLKTLRNDLDFVKSYQEEVDFLLKKGWFLPKSRLIAGEVLEKVHSSLNEIQYTFEPEITKKLQEGYTFRVTKIIVEVGALLDRDIYVFIEKILKEFPGILYPVEVTISRGVELNEKNLSELREKKRSNFIVGKLVFEWFATGGEGHER